MKLLLKQGRRVITIAIAFMLVLTLVPAVPVYAAGISINTTNFPDFFFRDYVKNNFDKNGDNVLSKEECSVVKEIRVQGKGITDLTGIKYFTNLHFLYCNNNLLTAFDVTKNTKLTSLDCSNNRLTTIDVTKNTRLMDLNCSNNQLTTIDVTKNMQLMALYCNSNLLTTLGVTKNTMLYGLYCSDNKLATLDVTKNTQLTSLDCSNNQLTTFDVTKNTRLERLWCERNMLTFLDLSKNTSINDLKIENHNFSVTLTGGKLNFSELPKGFDKNKVSNITGGIIEGDSFKFTGKRLKYKYDTGCAIGGVKKYLDVTLDSVGYSITCSGEGGTLSADKDNASSGEVVLLTLTPDAGYRFKSWEKTPTNLNIKSDNTFIMPDENVIIKAIFEAIVVHPSEHSITVQNDGNGNLTSDKSTAKAGDKVKLTVTPDAGYRFKSWEKTPTSLNIKSDNTFVMPDENVIIKAIFEKKPEYTIVVNKVGNGTASAEVETAYEGKEVKLTASAGDGYKFKEWQVAIPANLTITDNKFTMPNENVIIKAIFEAIVVHPSEHSITVQNDGNGNLTSDKSTAKVGDKVKLTVTPDAGYRFKSWEKTPASLEINSDNTFTMPDENVTIKAIFEKKPVTPPGGGGIVIPPGGGGGIVLPPTTETEEVKAAKEAAAAAVTEALKEQTFSGEEQKKAEELKKAFDEKLTKATTVEEVKKLETETLAAINVLWSDEEISLKAKVEAMGKSELIVKSKAVKTKKGAKAIRLSWNKVEDIDFDGYEIYRSTSRTKFGKTPFKTVEGTKTSYLNTKNLRKGKTYYYMLKAFKTVNGEKVYTDFSTKTWKTLKK